MADAQRGVVYTQKVVTDESVNREMTALADRAQQIQAMLGDFRLGGLDLTRFQTSVDRAHASMNALQQHARTPINLTAFSASAVATAPAPAVAPARSLPASGGGGGESKAPASPLGDLEKLKGTWEKVIANHKAADDKVTADAKAAAEKRAKENEKATVDLIKTWDKEDAANEKIQEKRRARLEKQTAADKKYWDSFVAYGAKSQAKREADEEKSAKAVSDKRSRENEKATADLIKHWDREEAKRVAADAKADKAREEQKKKTEENLKKLEEEHERAANKLISLNIRLRRSLAEVLAGTTELARGFVELGLIGEEDMEKIKDSILAVQSGVDLLRGGVGVWNALAESAHLYQERLEMVNRAQETAAAAKAAAGGLGIVGGGGGIVGAAGGEAVGGAVAAAGAGLATTAAAFVAAIGSSILALKVFRETVQDVSKYGLGGGSTRGSTSEKIGNAQAGAMMSALRFLDRIGLVNPEHTPIKGVGDEALIAEHRTERLQKAAERDRAAREEQERLTSEKFARQNEEAKRKLDAQLQVNAASNAVSPLASPEEQAAAHRKQLEEDRAAIEAEVERASRMLASTVGKSGEIGPGREEAVRAREEAEQRIEALRERELQLAREEREVAIDGARKKLQLLADQVQKQKDLIKSLNDEAQAAKDSEEDLIERLGKLSPAQANRLAEIKRKLVAGQDISAKEAEFAEPLADEEMKERLKEQRLKKGRAYQAQFAAGGAPAPAAAEPKPQQKTELDRLKEEREKLRQEHGPGSRHKLAENARQLAEAEHHDRTSRRDLETARRKAEAERRSKAAEFRREHPEAEPHLDEAERERRRRALGLGEEHRGHRRSREELGLAPHAQRKTPEELGLAPHGHRKSREELGLGPETSAEQAEREQERRLAEARKQDAEREKLARNHGQVPGQRPTPGVAFGNREHSNTQSAIDRATEANAKLDELSGQISQQQQAAEAANQGATFNLNVKNEVEAKITGDSETEGRIKAAVIAAAKEHFKSQEEKVKGWIREAVEQAKEESRQDANRTTQRRNQKAAAAS